MHKQALQDHLNQQSLNQPDLQVWLKIVEVLPDPICKELLDKMQKQSDLLSLLTKNLHDKAKALANHDRAAFEKAVDEISQAFV